MDRTVPSGESNAPSVGGSRFLLLAAYAESVRRRDGEVAALLLEQDVLQVERQLEARRNRQDMRCRTKVVRRDREQEQDVGVQIAGGAREPEVEPVQADDQLAERVWCSVGQAKLEFVVEGWRCGEQRPAGVAIGDRPH